MTQETDELWRYVHAIVNERVPPEHRAAVTDLVAQTTVFILTQPHFLHGLRIVQELQADNERLRRAVVSLQTAHMPKPTRPRKAATKKAAPRKKAAAKKAPAARKVPAAQKRAFKKGATGR